MEDLTLLDLLECPLCLERLDVSAKVFPCQHTFCKPCLQQEAFCSPQQQQQQQQVLLCCPECRTPAQARSVGELPENLLLVRLLEGLEQVSMGPGRGTARQSARYSVPNNMTLREGQQQESPPSSQHRDKQGDSEVVPRALHNHGRGGNGMGELVLSTANSSNNSRQKMEEGLHQSSGGPGAANLLQDVNLTPQSQPLALCRALSDFNPSTLDQEDYKYCLRFLKGDILTVVRRVDEHWIEAKLGDKVGILPLQFTEPNSAAVKLLEGKNRKGRDSSESCQRTGSGSKDKAADAPDRTNHFGVLQLQAKTPTINVLPSSQGKQLGVGSSAIYQPANICTFNGLQGPTPHLSTAPANHGLAPPSRVTSQKGRSDGTHRHLSQGEKKMNSEPPPTISMALVNPQVTPPSTDSKHSSSTQQLSISVCATLYSYKPRRPEELELRKGEMVGVYGKFKEGWLRGLSLRTGKVGILPGSYVTPVLRTSARLLETKAATTSSPAAVKRPTASRNPAVVLALDRVNTDGTMYSTGQVPSVLNGAQHAAPSAGAEKLSLYGVSQGWDTVRRAFNPPHRGSTQRGNHYIHTSTSSHLSHSHNFAQVQASGCSPALQRKKHSSILPSPGRPLGRMSDTIAPPSGAMPNGRDFTGLKEATFDRKPFTNGPHSILVRPDSHKNNTDKPVKSVRFFTDEDPSPPRLRASSWSGGHQASSAGRPGSLPLEVWAPSLTLGRDGPGIVLKEGKNPVLRKGLETTVSDLNSSLQKPSQTSLSAASAQYSPSRHRVTTTYLAQTDSELSLLQGELVVVHRPRPDGRLLVTQECSGLTGLFHSSVLHAMERLS